jgi:simple sugar transport system ATP-binding protein
MQLILLGKRQEINKMKNSKYAIEMVNITKTFNNGTIIANDNLSLKVKKGDIVALVGENGAGKSTLMSILFGMYQPTSGEIYINGELVNIASPVKANDLGIGMVHQHFKLVEINRV